MVPALVYLLPPTTDVAKKGQGLNLARRSSGVQSDSDGVLAAIGPYMGSGTVEEGVTLRGDRAQ